MILPVLLLAVHAQAPVQAPPASFVLSHRAVDCVIADKHPRFEAQAPQGVEVAAARVFFQGASQEWYSVAMKAEGPALVGILPTPKRSLKEFHYYIEATSKNLEISRTADRATRVVNSAGECRGIVTATAISTASILVQGPAGAAAVPAGFAPAGLVAAGGGISATTVAVGAAVVGGGALAATQISGGGDSDGGSYAGPVSGELTLTFGPCVRRERYSFTLLVQLTKTGGSAGTESGKSEVLSAANCATGPQTGQVDTFGMSQGPLTRTGNSVTFSSDQASAESSTRMDFQGTLSGDVISGTVTMIRRVPNLTGTSTSTPLVAPVSLALRK